MTDARERRRQRAQETSKAHPMETLKKYRAPIIIVLLWLAIVGYQVAAQRGLVGDPEGRCPGHWHATTQVYLDDGNPATDDQLTFDPRLNPQFGNADNGHHLHDTSGRLHMHPGTTRCIDLGDVYKHLGITVSDDAVKVDQRFTYGTPVQAEYRNNETHEVRVYVQEWDYARKAPADTWKRIHDIDGFMGRQVGNGDKVLVTFVAKDVGDDVLAAQQESIEEVGASYTPQGRSIFVPVMAATIFAGLGLVLWRLFAKAAVR